MFGLPLVITQDFDGDLRLRFAHKTPFGWRCNSLITLTGQYSVHLNANGTTSGKSYVSFWKPANKKAIEITL